MHYLHDQRVQGLLIIASTILLVGIMNKIGGEKHLFFNRLREDLANMKEQGKAK